MTSSNTPDDQILCLVLAVLLASGSNIAAMKDDDGYGSDDPIWLFAVVAMFTIGGLVMLHVSPTIDMILRGGFILAFIGYLQTYFPKKK